MKEQDRKIVWMCLALLGGCAGPSTVETPGSDAAITEGQDGTQQGGTLGDGEITHGGEAGLLGKDSGLPGKDSGLPGKDSGLPTEAGKPTKPKVEPTLQRMSMAEAKQLVDASPSPSPFAGKLLLSPKGGTRIVRVAYSPKGGYLAAAIGKAIHVWSMPISTDPPLVIHTDEIWAIAWHPDEQYLAAVVKPWTENQETRIWTPSGAHWKTIKKGSHSLEWSPDGEFLATGWKGGAYVFPVSEGRVWGDSFQGFDEYLEVSWSLDGKSLYVATLGKVQVWSRQEKSTAMDDDANKVNLQGNGSKVSHVATDPSGTRLFAIGSQDNTVKIWSKERLQTPQVLKGHTDAVMHVAWSPDGQRIASGSWDKTVRIWSTETEKCLRTLPEKKEKVNTVSWSADGMHLAAGYFNGKVMVWKMVGETLLHKAVESGLLGFVEAALTKFPELLSIPNESGFTPRAMAEALQKKHPAEKEFPAIVTHLTTAEAEAAK